LIEKGIKMSDLLVENGYVDIHSHVIFGVDDGSKSLEMSVEMLKRNYAEGVRTMFATPHNYPGEEHSISLIKERYKILKEKAYEIGEDFKLLLGNEVLYRKNIVEELDEGDCLTMNDTRYVLTEFVPGEKYDTIYTGLLDMVREGYIPIIAHIERVNCLHEGYKNLQELIDMGCLMQINTELLVGGVFNKMTKRLFNLIELDMVHFLGTDCHNITTRPPLFDKPMQKLQKKLQKSSVDKLNKCDILIGVN
jgi:protein-tyrosine phosphatase